MPRPRPVDTDTPSIMFSALTTRVWGRTFALTAELNVPVDPALLSRALQSVLPAYPNMRLDLRKGFFWARQVPVSGMPEIRPADGRLRPITAKYRGRLNFRLTYEGNRLWLESAHVLGDGRGHRRFFISILDVYARLLQGEDPPAKTPRQGVMEDAFLRFYQKDGDKADEDTGKAFHFPEVVEPGFLSMSFAEMPVPAVKTLAHGREMTVTEYLSAVLLLAVTRAEQTPIDQKISLAVPVDLRRFFPSGTCRNFVIQSEIPFYPKGRRDLTLDAVVGETRGLLKSRLKPEVLLRSVNRFVSLRQNPVLGAVPYFIKKPVLGVLQKKTHKRFTTIFTNVGETTLPPTAASIVKSLGFVNGDTGRYGLPVTVSCISGAGTLSVCFSAVNHDTRFFDAFVGILGEEGLDVNVRRIAPEA